MTTENRSGWTIVEEGTLAQVKRVLGDVPAGEERQRRIEALAAEFEITPVQIIFAINAGVDRAVEQGIITYDEAKQLLGRCGV